MNNAISRLARRIRPDIEELTGQQQISATADVLTILYILPLMVIGLVIPCGAQEARKSAAERRVILKNLIQKKNILYARNPQPLGCGLNRTSFSQKIYCYPDNRICQGGYLGKHA
jgi:hypothetical protein